MKKTMVKNPKQKKRRTQSAIALAIRQRRRRRFDPEVRRWNLWCHDLDTLLHELVKNPALAEVPAVELVARAEAFADALHNMQDRRRPEGFTPEDDGF
jgi:hypothetical protein